MKRLNSTTSVQFGKQLLKSIAVSLNCSVALCFFFFPLLRPNNKVFLKMASLKTRCLLAFAALLRLSITPTAAEVMGSISDCAEFFLQDTPPCIPGVLEGGRNLNQNRYKTICQTWKNKRRFVTLYDTNNKIPVFSACKYKRPDASPRPKTKWKVEPQVGF